MQSDFQRRGWKPSTLSWCASINSLLCVVLLFALSCGKAIGMRGELWGCRWGSASSYFSLQPASIPFSSASGELEHDGWHQEDEGGRREREEQPVSRKRRGRAVVWYKLISVDQRLILQLDREKKVVFHWLFYPVVWRAAAWVIFLWQTGSDSASAFVTHPLLYL